MQSKIDILHQPYMFEVFFLGFTSSFFVYVDMVTIDFKVNFVTHYSLILSVITRISFRIRFNSRFIPEKKE